MQKQAKSAWREERYMDCKKAGLLKILLGIYLCAIVCSGTSMVSEAAKIRSGDLMEGAEYENGEIFHPEGDMILTADYTMPEDTTFYWYNGSLTIASGVTLTIPEGSCLEINSPGESFTVEEGACIRIEGEPREDEYGRPLTNLHAAYARTQIDGSIESENAGLLCQWNKVYLNAQIHTRQTLLFMEECQVSITGGEYISEEEPLIDELYMDYYESVAEISGGVFSTDKIQSCLAKGYALQKQDEGVYEAVPAAQKETASESERPAGFMERAKQIPAYAQKLFEEAKGDSIREDGSWVNGDIVVVILCVAVVGICLLLVIIDFIRSPFKKKLKILLELSIAVGIVGGGLMFLWHQVVEEKNMQAEKSQADYDETDVPQTMVLQKDGAELDGMEVYPEGTYLVGKDLEPGVYFLETVYPEGKPQIFYVHSSASPDFTDKEVGAWAKRAYLELKDGTYIRVIGADFVRNGEQPAYESADQEGVLQFPHGDYLVGYDIAPGRYQLTIDRGETVICSGTMQTEAMNFARYGGTSYTQETGSTEIQLKEGDHMYVMLDDCAGLSARD